MIFIILGLTPFALAFTAMFVTIKIVARIDRRAAPQPPEFP